MSGKINVGSFFSGRREGGKTPSKYNIRSAVAFRAISPNSSTSSDSCEDSFEQICKTSKNSFPSEGDSMLPLPSDSICAKNDEECKELDEMFKNIDLKDSSDSIPIEWLDVNIRPMANCAALSTVYEGSESKYCSTKSISPSISKESQHLELSQDSLVNLMKSGETSKDSLERSHLIDSKTIELNDTLEDVEYVCDERNRYLLKPVSKKLSTSISPTRSSSGSVIAINSSPETSFATAPNDVDVKNIKTEILSDESSNLHDTKETLDSDRDISLAPTVSSTNLSFTTARNDFKLNNTVDIKSEFSEKSSTLSCGKTDSWSSLDASENSSTAPITDKEDDKSRSSMSTNAKSEVLIDSPMFSSIAYPKTTSFFELDQDSDIGKSSDYYTAANTNGSSTSELSFSGARYNTMDDIPSFSTDSAVSSFNPSNVPQNYSTDSSKNFNDSLERIEYMMRKGRELQQGANTKATCDKPSAAPSPQLKTPTSKKLTGSSQKQKFATASSKTPVVKPKLLTNSAKKPTHPSPQAVTPATRILKPHNRAPVQSTMSQPKERKYISPRVSPGISPAFKKPNFPTPSVSRIPTTKGKHFEHIVSPIGAYIKNIAAPPLLANVKPTSDFFDSSYCNKMSKGLDYSVVSDGGAESKPVASLPVKFFTSSEHQRVIDGKLQKIPGGEKMYRIIGQIPSVTTHQGRIHSGSPLKRNIPIDDSFANVSVMSGDISVQVVKDVKRH